jgi:hypothetical protein
MDNILGGYMIECVEKFTECDPFLPGKFGTLKKKQFVSSRFVLATIGF